MSVVYKGKHLVLNRDVAVKIILPGLGSDGEGIAPSEAGSTDGFFALHMKILPRSMTWR